MNDLHRNVLDVAIDDIILHLTDLVKDAPADEVEEFTARLKAAQELKGMTLGEVADPVYADFDAWSAEHLLNDDDTRRSYARVAFDAARMVHEDPVDDNCTPAQRKRWVELQVDLPGVEIERCPGGIGYWSRNAGYPCPKEDGEERESWLQADGDIKEDGEQPVQMLKRLIGQIRSTITLQAVFEEVTQRMLGVRSSYHPGDDVLVVSKLYTGPGKVATWGEAIDKVATWDEAIDNDRVPVQLPEGEAAAEIFRRTHGSGLWLFKVGELAPKPILPVRPQTRGELRDRLAKGETCEVAAHAAEMTNIMLEGWLQAVPFEVVPSPNPGWVLYRPTTPPAEPRGSEHPIDGDIGLG